MTVKELVSEQLQIFMTWLPGSDYIYPASISFGIIQEETGDNEPGCGKQTQTGTGCR